MLPLGLNTEHTDWNSGVKWNELTCLEDCACVCLSVCNSLTASFWPSEWGQGFRSTVTPHNPWIVPTLLETHARVKRSKQTDDATYNLFSTSSGDLVLHPALEKETVGERVLTLGAEEEGETDTVTQRLWLKEAEMERGERETIRRWRAWYTEPESWKTKGRKFCLHVNSWGLDERVTDVIEANGAAICSLLLHCCRLRNATDGHTCANRGPWWTAATCAPAAAAAAACNL